MLLYTRQLPLTLALFSAHYIDLLVFNDDHSMLIVCVCLQRTQKVSSTFSHSNTHVSLPYSERQETKITISSERDVSKCVTQTAFTSIN